MSSWGGDSGMTPGDGSEVDRGSVRDVAPATGTARVVLGFMFIWLAAISFVLWLFITRERDGLLLLTTIFCVAFFWSAGVFSRAFWRR